jgi:hypothetical protein
LTSFFSEVAAGGSAAATGHEKQHEDATITIAEAARFIEYRVK